MTVTVEKTDATMLSTVRDYGDHALLLELNSTAEVLAWTDTLREAGIPGVLDIVPASQTILLKLVAPRFQEPTRQRLARLHADWFTDQSTGPSEPDLVLDVRYDGEDLAEVADYAGLSIDDVVAAHTGSLWRVAFGGFTPGFAYLVGGDPRLQVPRRSEPRTRVPAGSVALAGEFSGMYPRETPGGWQLIGRTDVALWDLHRPQPALLIPGMTVQFRAIGGTR